MENWIVDFKPVFAPSQVVNMERNEVSNCNGRKLAICNGIDSDHLRVLFDFTKEVADDVSGF